jgi:hypothetical protein
MQLMTRCEIKKHNPKFALLVIRSNVQIVKKSHITQLVKVRLYVQTAIICMVLQVQNHSRKIQSLKPAIPAMQKNVVRSCGNISQ